MSKSNYVLQENIFCTVGCLMNATLTYRAQMVAVISLVCNDTNAGGSTVTSNFGSTVNYTK